jgi:hypothetical protein
MVSEVFRVFQTAFRTSRSTLAIVNASRAKSNSPYRGLASGIHTEVDRIVISRFFEQESWSIACLLSILLAWWPQPQESRQILPIEEVA